jgi:citrate lyase subunit beta/citryl-CoA lyase
MALTRIPASYLFVPGSRPNRFDSALGSGADAIVLDLEDAVAPGDKVAARAAIRAWYAPERERHAQVLVRINDTTTAWFDDDLAVLRATGIRAVVLPKAETAGQVERAGAALPEGGAVVPIIETARGALEVEAVAAARGVQRLAFGTLDYAVDLDLSGDERGLLYTASRMAIASKVHGLASPIAGVTATLDDDLRLRADLGFARACGFGAKFCIHPQQVAAINSWFAPSADELEWARRVLAAAAGNEGAFALDGRMIDRPVILKARALLERARD